MKRWMRILFGTVLAVVCLMSMCAPAFADQTPATASVPVTVSLKGAVPTTAENYTIRLVADNTEFPMPAGSVASADGLYYDLTVTGAAKTSFPAITYNRVGVYTYKVFQIAGKNTRCTYDNTIYSLTITITNSEDGSALESIIAIHSNKTDVKPDSAEFVNRYLSPYDPKTDDESNPLLYVAAIVFGVALTAVLIKTRTKKGTEE